MTLLRPLILAAALVATGRLAAQVPAPAGEEDAALSRSAYAALLKGEGLADVPIGVKVFKDGTAVLWGSARPADAAKAEAVLKKVPGITGVVNTCDPTAAPAGARVTPPKLPDPPGAAVSRPTTAEKRAEGPAAVLLDPLAATGPVDYAAVERVRRADPRFSRLTLDLRDGRVVISGPAADPTAPYDLARQISPLVGNRDVAVKSR